MKKFLLIYFLIFYGSLKSEAQTTNENVVRKFTYQTLSTYQKQLFDDFIEDEIPTGKTVESVLTDNTSLRSKTRVAEGLLFRNQSGDKEKAQVILKWILANQYQDENSKLYGTWKTSIVNDKFDQNWREFIGCDLIIIRQKFKTLLPNELIAEIEKCLIHAAKGALKRNVGADYTNISIMSSFLMEYVGNEFGIEELKSAGFKKAKDIYKLYQTNKTFSEYNSPTYYGVTLVGLGLWRELAFSDEIKKMGRELENNLWEEISLFYNPNLRNMAGPYFRGYGMDMTKYFAITGIWIAVAANNPSLAPIPPKKAPKYGEMSNLPPIYVLGLSVPKSVLNAFTSFQKPHFISRNIPNNYKGDSIKKVTAMINKDWMMAGVWGNRRVWEQFKTGTIHWKTKTGDVAWLMILGDGKLNVKVSETEMNLFLSDSKVSDFEVFVYAKDLNNEAFKAENWQLPSMNIVTKSSLEKPLITKIEDEKFHNDLAVSDEIPFVYKLKFQVPANWNLEKPVLTLVPQK